eukprot:1297032-Amphidinium_carterae.1
MRGSGVLKRKMHFASLLSVDGIGAGVAMEQALSSEAIAKEEIGSAKPTGIEAWSLSCRKVCSTYDIYLSKAYHFAM